MNDNTTKIIFKVIGVLYILFGLLVACSAVTVLLGVAGVQYGQGLADQLGRGDEVAGFPTQYALIGGLAFGVYSVFYLAAGLGLVMLKKWADKAMIGLVVAGAVVIAYTTFTISFPVMEVVWLVAYAALAYWLSRKKNLLTN